MLPPFAPAVLEEIAKVLGDAMRGSEITRMLAQCQLRDTSQQSTKWRRLLDNFSAIQARDCAGDAVARFIVNAMAPARFLNDRGAFESARGNLNRALHFAGPAATRRIVVTGGGLPIPA